MKIFDREGTPNAARIRIVAAEKGLDDQIEYVSVDLIAAEQKQPAFLAMNPVGKTPVLVLDDGLAISECTAITVYLDNLDGKPALTGRSPREMALIHMMQRRVEIMLLEPIDDYFHYGTPGLGAMLKPWRMPDWEHRADWGRRRGNVATGNFAYFDKWLSERPFLTGDTYSMADITLYATLAFARGIGLQVGEQHKHLDAWTEAMASLPAVRNRSGQEFRKEDIERRG